jgi:hypothetical protein
MFRLWEETVQMFLLGRDGKNIATILNIKWKRTPLRVLLQGSSALIVAPARNLLAAAKLHLVQLVRLLT